MQKAYLDHADSRGNATNNLEDIGGFSHIYTDAEVRLLPLHSLQEPLGRWVGVRSHARGIGLACGRHLGMVVLCEMHILMFSSRSAMSQLC